VVSPLMRLFSAAADEARAAMAAVAVAVTVAATAAALCFANGCA